MDKENVVKVKSLSHIQLFETSWTIVCQAPPSMELSRQEYWSELSFPISGDLADLGIKPTPLDTIKFPRFVVNRNASVLSCFLCTDNW